MASIFRMKPRGVFDPEAIQTMDRSDYVSDHQVTWLDITSMFIILALTLGSLTFVSLLADSPQSRAGTLPRTLLSGTNGAVFDGSLLIAPDAANAEEDGADRRVDER